MRRGGFSCGSQDAVIVVMGEHMIMVDLCNNNINICGVK